MTAAINILRRHFVNILLALGAISLAWAYATDRADSPWALVAIGVAVGALSVEHARWRRTR